MPFTLAQNSSNKVYRKVYQLGSEILFKNPESYHLPEYSKLKGSQEIILTIVKKVRSKELKWKQEDFIYTKRSTFKTEEIPKSRV